MTRRFDLCCLGEPLLEFNARHGGEGEARTYLEAHGGDASNVAIASARQGAEVAFLSAVGDDLGGKSFRALWERENVDASGVLTDSERPTGVYFVSHDADGHHFTYLRKGSAASAYRLDETARRVLVDAATVFASGISLGISERGADTVFEAFALARQAGAQTAFDTNYRPRLWPARRAGAVIREALSQADIAFPGLEDAQALWGMHEPDAIADFCLTLGVRTVVLKMGAEGALLATSEGRQRIAPFPCSPVDATGAGDTFCGAFLARLSQGASPEEAARHAACAAALATTGYGAVPPIPARDAVEKALAGVSPA